MATADRQFGWMLTAMAVGPTGGNEINLLVKYRDFEARASCQMMDARVPHDTVAYDGWRFPRVKSRTVEISLSGVIDNLTGNANNMFDMILQGSRTQTYQCQIVGPGLSISCVASLASEAGMNFPGDEALENIRLKCYDLVLATV